MLRELDIRNLAVVAAANVRFGPGLNALTGETGAGKSIVVDSLALLAGGRAATELIRTGAEQLTVTGIFEPAGDEWRRVLDEAGLEVEGAELLVRREISRSGRNRVFVNDQPATLRLLTDLQPYLLRIHGQREELELTAADLQRAWLDKSGGEAAAALLQTVGEAYAVWAGLAARLAGLSGNEQLRRERIDLLRFQVEEIDGSQLVAGEDVALAAEREQLRHLEAIRRALGSSLDLLYDDEGAAGERLAKSVAALTEIAGWETRAAGWARELEELRIRTDEVAAALRARLEGLEGDPGRLDLVEARLATLERLSRKYRCGVDEILALRGRLGEELEELTGDHQSTAELEAKVAAALAVYHGAAAELSTARKLWGDELTLRMHEELTELGLAQAKLEVALERRRRQESPLVVDGEMVEFGAHGFDHVVFLFAPNPGERAQPLARVASGGELSRLSLALQLAAGTAGVAGRPALVFDEVDTGIGGAQAAALGKKLQRLATAGQILAVTHLPQVASCADQHFKVDKVVAGGRTQTAVATLVGNQRVLEIARMLAGSTVTETSRSHAQELLEGSARVVEPAASGRRKSRR